MTPTLRENLRIILSLALTQVPRSIRRAYSERSVARCDPAKARMVSELMAELDRHFDLSQRPETPLRPPLGSESDGGSPGTGPVERRPARK